MGEHDPVTGSQTVHGPQGSQTPVAGSQVSHNEHNCIQFPLSHFKQAEHFLPQIPLVQISHSLHPTQFPVTGSQASQEAQVLVTHLSFTQSSQGPHDVILPPFPH